MSAVGHHATHDARAAVQASGLHGPAGVLADLLAARYTCRAYSKKSVPRETIEAILALAQLTAAWCNTQPWEVVITSGEETARLVELLMAEGPNLLVDPKPDIPWPSEYRGVYADRKREAGRQLYEAVGIPRGDRAAAERQVRENLRLFGAPHVAVITVDQALGPYGAIDCGAYVANFMLAARAFGLDSSAQAALAGCAPVLRRCLDIGDDRSIVCGIAFGYGDAAHAANSFRTGRVGLDAAASLRGFTTEASDS